MKYMTGRTHEAFAFASLLTVAAIAPPSAVNVPTVLLAVVATTVGCLLPDMDQATNKLWGLLPAGDFMGKIFRRIFWSHRTLSHSLLGMYIFYKLFNFLLPILFNSNVIYNDIILSSLMIGYFSHLLADALTRDGIPLFFPFRLQVGFPPVSWLRIKTDGFVERFLILPGLLVYVVWIIYSFQDKFLVIARSIHV